MSEHCFVFGQNPIKVETPKFDFKKFNSQKKEKKVYPHKIEFEIFTARHIAQKKHFFSNFELFPPILILEKRRNLIKNATF